MLQNCYLIYFVNSYVNAAPLQFNLVLSTLLYSTLLYSTLTRFKSQSSMRFNLSLSLSLSLCLPLSPSYALSLSFIFYLYLLPPISLNLIFFHSLTHLLTLFLLPDDATCEGTGSSKECCF